MRALTSDLEHIEAIFLDLYGTIYMGDNLIEGAIDFLNRIEKRGIKRYFLSNNSSKSVNQYLTKLEKMVKNLKMKNLKFKLKKSLYLR